MLGMILEAKEHNDEFQSPWMIFILAPFTLPVFIGIKLEELTRKK